MVFFISNKCFTAFNTGDITPQFPCSWRKHVLIVRTETDTVEQEWRSGNVMDCHSTARGSIPGGNVLCKGQ